MNETNEHLEALGRFVDAVDAIGIDYMLTSSLALSVYAEPRMTADGDVVIKAKPDDVPFLTRVLAEEFVVQPEMILDAVVNVSMFNVLREGALAKVDVIIADGSERTEDEFDRRRTVRVDDREIKVISPEDLAIENSSGQEMETPSAN